MHYFQPWPINSNQKPAFPVVILNLNFTLLIPIHVYISKKKRNYHPHSQEMKRRGEKISIAHGLWLFTGPDTRWCRYRCAPCRGFCIECNGRSWNHVAHYAWPDVSIMPSSVVRAVKRHWWWSIFLLVLTRATARKLWILPFALWKESGAHAVKLGGGREVKES